MKVSESVPEGVYAEIYDVVGKLMFAFGDEAELVEKLVL